MPAYGSSEYYGSILGGLELIGAIVLWIPRTTIIGAIVTAIMLTNILLMDILCNVNIRILTALLLIGCIFLLFPELKHYIKYCFMGTTVRHRAAVYSLAQRTASGLRYIIIRTLGCISASSDTV